MADAILNIERWANNLGVRIPAAVALDANLHVDQRVHVSVEGDRVVITPLDGSRLTLEQRVAAYDPKRHGGEEMTTTKTIGAERWQA